MQETADELDGATPRGSSRTPRQSSLEREESTGGKAESQPPSAKKRPANSDLEGQKGDSKADQPGHQKPIKMAKSSAVNADRKGETDPQSIGQRMRDAVQGLKHKLGHSLDGNAKVMPAILSLSLSLGMTTSLQQERIIARTTGRDV